MKILVVPGPQNVFTDDELSYLKSVVERGDSVLVTMSDGGEEKMNTNINFFLEEYGIVVNNGECPIIAPLLQVLSYRVGTVARTIYTAKYGFQGENL